MNFKKKHLSCLSILLISLYCFSSQSSAAFLGNVKIQKLYGNTSILFGVNHAPNDVCSYFGRHFKLDATTEGGKNMLSILLAAHISNKDIDVWYSASSAPNTDETNGCTNGGSIADVISIGFAT